MIIKREKKSQIITPEGTQDVWTEIKQEISIPDAKTLVVDERIHVCFHDETPFRPCHVITSK